MIHRWRTRKARAAAMRGWERGLLRGFAYTRPRVISRDDLDTFYGSPSDRAWKIAFEEGKRAAAEELERREKLMADPPQRIPFASRCPDPDKLPTSVWAKVYAEVMR